MGIPNNKTTPFHFFSHYKIVISLVGCFVFFNIFFNQFVWDDVSYIVLNPSVHSVDIIQLFKPNFFNSAGYYRPLSATYFALLHAIFNNTPFFYHFIQIALHIINTLLVFTLFTVFFSRISALYLSLFFLIHPIQVESIAYIGASQSEIYTFFGLLALLRFIKKPLMRTTDMCFLTLFGLLAIFTKETGFLYILLIFLYALLWRRESLKKLFIVLGLILLVYFSVRIFLGNVFFQKIQKIPIARLPLFERAVSIPKIFFYYIRTFIFPQDLAIDQQWIVKNITLKDFWLPLISVKLIFLWIAGIVFVSYRRGPEYYKTAAFFACWFIFGMALLLQVFPLDMTVADRWFYFPMIGLLGIIGILIKLFSTQISKHKLFMTCITISILILLGLRTMVRNTNWYSEYVLYSHDIAIESNFDTEGAYGVVLASKGELKDAYLHEKKSVSMNPYDVNLSNLGIIAWRMGKLKDAEKYMIQSLNAEIYDEATHKHDAAIYENLTEFYIKNHKYNNALDIIKMGINDLSEVTPLQRQQAIVEYRLKHYDNAKKIAEEISNKDKSEESNNFYNLIINRDSSLEYIQR